MEERGIRALIEGVAGAKHRPSSWEHINRVMIHSPHQIYNHSPNIGRPVNIPGNPEDSYFSPHPGIPQSQPGTCGSSEPPVLPGLEGDDYSGVGEGKPQCEGWPGATRAVAAAAPPPATH